MNLRTHLSRRKPQNFRGVSSSLVNALPNFTQKNVQPMWLYQSMKISFRYHRLLIYDIKRTTKIDGMGPFKHGVLYEKIWDIQKSTFSSSTSLFASSTFFFSSSFFFFSSSFFLFSSFLALQ